MRRSIVLMALLMLCGAIVLSPTILAVSNGQTDRAQAPAVSRSGCIQAPVVNQSGNMQAPEMNKSDAIQVANVERQVVSTTALIAKAVKFQFFRLLGIMAPIRDHGGEAITD